MVEIQILFCIPQGFLPQIPVLKLEKYTICTLISLIHQADAVTDLGTAFSAQYAIDLGCEDGHNSSWNFT
jgi:hypothetical protein